MDLLERFKALWRGSFKEDVPIEILSRLEACVEGGSTNVDKLTRAYQETKQCIESMQNRLNQEEFVQNFLKQALKEMNVSVSVFVSNPDDLYAKVNKSHKCNQHTDLVKRDSQIISPSSSECDDIDGAYSEIQFDRQEEKVAQESEKKISSGRGSVKDKVRKFELIEKVQLYSSSSDSSGEYEQEENPLKGVNQNPQCKRWRRHINSYEEIAEVNPTLSFKRQDSNATGGQSVVGSVHLINTQDISKFQGDEFLNHRLSGTNCITTKQSSSVADKSIDTPLIARSCTQSTVLRTAIPEFNSKSERIVKEDTNSTLVLESYAGEILESNYQPDLTKLTPSVDKVDDEDSWYSDVKHLDHNFCTQKSQKKFVTAVQVTSTSQTDTLKKQQGLKQNDAMSESTDSGDLGTTDDNMHLFRKHSTVEDKSVVGKRFKSLSSSGSDDEKPYDNAGTLNRENLNSAQVKPPERLRKMASPILAKKKPHTSIPDYENWSLNAVLTLPGISLAEQEFHIDTGSEDDLDDSPSLDKFETESKHSTDSGVCEDGMSRGENGEKMECLTDTNLKTIQRVLTTYYRRHRFSNCSYAVFILDRMKKSTSRQTTSTTSQEPVFLHEGNAGSSSFIPGSIPTISLSVPQEEEEEGEGGSIQSGDLEPEDNGSISSLEESKDKDHSEMSEKESSLERTKKLYTRNLVLKGILESDRTYLGILDELLKAKIFLQTCAQRSNSTIDPSHVTTMFYKLDEIHAKHKEFVQGLEKQMSISGDDQRIGDSFKLMVFYLKIYEEYVNNYPQAVALIHKYVEDENVRPLLQQIMEPFNQETNRLEEILLKPVQRMQRNTLVLHDLLKYTPDDHPDYTELQKALKLSEENLRTFNIHLGELKCMNPKRARHLVKSGFVVEVAKKETRQLRYLFLFNDILICTKHKRSNRSREVNYKLVWSIQLTNIKVEIPEITYSCKDSTDVMKAKIGNLKAEIKEEMKKEEEAKEKTFSITGRRAAKMVEKLKKKIQEQEAMLVEALPHLPLKLKEQNSQSTSQSHLLLFPTEYEREDWRESLEAQGQRNIIGGEVPQLSTHDLEALINNNKQHTEVNSIGYKLLEKDEEVLNGILNVTIHRLYGLDNPCDTYCCLEMDSYGHFYKKAQTHVCYGSAIPSWDEDFELDLDASQSLRMLCFRRGFDGEKDVILGKCALELSMDWLKCEFHEKTVTMNEVSLTVSIRHTPASKTLNRTPSKVSTGIFGIKIGNVTRRERKTIPAIVIACTQEINKRGLEEVGIYRVSGVTSEVQRLKRLFNKNPVAAGIQIAEVDIHAVTGVLKLYFRELPEPLFTDANYHQFLHLVELSDEEAKEKCMLELLHSLPEPNYYTIVHMIEHLFGVAKLEKENKMSLQNLSTIFGPTLLHPAVRESAIVSMDQIASVTQQAIMQAEVLLYFLKLVALGRNIRKSAVVTKM